MFFIFKLVLIILLNGTYAYITQDIETILLPTWNPTGVKKILLTLKVFGKQIQLNLRRNDQIVPSMFKVWKRDAMGITKQLSQLNTSDPCYYLHKDNISTATMNFCHQHGWKGFVLLKDDTLEIKPLRNDASLPLIDDLCIKEEINISFGKPHVVKRSLQLSADSSFQNSDNFKRKRHVENSTEKKLTIELAVFLDKAAYHAFKHFLDRDKKVLREIMLSYVSNIQAVFHHPSLGVSIDILLVYLEIMEEQPYNLPASDDAGELLRSFCEYAEIENFADDNDSRHWDVGLYLTGIDIYFSSEATVGMANPGSVCKLNESCAIAEFGITDEVSSGFTSSLIAAHEIAHVLGIKHDAKPCDIDNYIMSPYRTKENQIIWSNCSRYKAENLDLWTTQKCLRDHVTFENDYDYSHYQDLPGRQWTANAQCKIYFRDGNANVVSLVDICKTLQCEIPYQKEIISTGPALEGTHCALGKECRGGECVPALTPPYTLDYCEDDELE